MQTLAGGVPATGWGTLSTLNVKVFVVHDKNLVQRQLAVIYLKWWTGGRCISVCFCFCQKLVSFRFGCHFRRCHVIHRQLDFGVKLCLRPQYLSRSFAKKGTLLNKWANLLAKTLNSHSLRPTRVHINTSLVCVSFQAGKIELLILQRISVLVLGVLASFLAIYVDSVYGMFIMAADIVFVILFPQLVAVVFISFSNTYGALTGYIVGLVLRLGAGEPFLDLNPAFHYPFYDPEMGQLFPFRTVAMISSFLCILSVSKIFEILFEKCSMSKKLDVFNCFKSGSLTLTGTKPGQIRPTNDVHSAVHLETFKSAVASWDVKSKRVICAGPQASRFFYFSASPQIQPKQEILCERTVLSDLKTEQNQGKHSNGRKRKHNRFFFSRKVPQGRVVGKFVHRWELRGTAPLSSMRLM